MIIGTIRAEEARAFDSDAGFHQFHVEDPDSTTGAIILTGSFEVFWAEPIDANNQLKPGWYWRACFPGCTPAGERFGPFATSALARADADPLAP